MKHRYLYFFCILLASCNPHLDIPDLYEAPLYIDRYVAIGDMYSAGTINKGWTYDGKPGMSEQGQEYALAALLASQFQQFRYFEFTQPLVTGTTGNQRLAYYEQAFCPSLPAIDSISWDTATVAWTQLNWQEDLDNLAVPGLRMRDWATTDPSAPVSPIFQQMAGSGKSYADYLATNPADFYTVWLGMEDILYAAAAGMAFPDRKPLDGDAFAAEMKNLLLSLASPDGKPRIVVGLLPDVTNFPYFRKQAYRWQENTGCLVSFSDIFIQTANEGIRVATAEDRILLPARYWIGRIVPGGKQGLDLSHPVPDSLVLDRDERQQVQQLIQSYNNGIRATVESLERQYPYTSFALASLDPAFTEIVEGGLRLDGLILSTDYLLGDVFSLDGLTFSPRGNALVANLWIQAINQTPGFRAKVPPLNLANYPGVLFP